jgi:hypothetical protein
VIASSSTDVLKDGKKKVLKRRFSKKKPVLHMPVICGVVCLIGMYGVLWKVKSTIPVYILDN